MWTKWMHLMEQQQQKAQETKSQAHNAKTDKPREELQWELSLIVLTESNSELVLSCFGK